MTGHQQGSLVYLQQAFFTAAPKIQHPYTIQFKGVMSDFRGHVHVCEIQFQVQI